MAEYTITGLPLMALEGGVIQIGSYVFQPDDVDKLGVIIEKSKTMRSTENAPNRRTKKSDSNTDTA